MLQSESKRESTDSRNAANYAAFVTGLPLPHKLLRQPRLLLLTLAVFAISVLLGLLVAHGLNELFGVEAAQPKSPDLPFTLFWSMGLLWAYWAGRIYACALLLAGILLMGLMGISATFELWFCCAEAVGLLIFHLTLSGFSSDRFGTLRDIGIFVVASFFGAIAAATLGLAPEIFRSFNAVALLESWERWWMVHWMGAACVALPIGTLLLPRLERLKAAAVDTHFDMAPISPQRQLVVVGTLCGLAIVFCSSWFLLAWQPLMQELIPPTGERPDSIAAVAKIGMRRNAVLVVLLLGIVGTAVTLLIILQRRIESYIEQEERRNAGRAQRARLQRLAMNTAFEAIVARLTPEQTIRQVGQALEHLFPEAVVTGFLSAAEASGQLEVVYHSIESAGENSVRVPIERTLAGRAFLDRRVHFIEHNYARHPLADLTLALPTGFHIEAYIGFPLMGETRNLGAIQMLFANPFHPEDEERQLFWSIGYALGTALERAQVQVETRRRNAGLQALHKITQEVTSLNDELGLMQYFMQAARRLLPVKGVCALGLRQREELVFQASQSAEARRFGPFLETIAASDDPQIPRAGTRFALDDPGMAVSVVLEGRSVEYGLSDSVSTGRFELAAQWYAEAAYLAPLPDFDGKVLGILVLIFTEPHLLDETERFLTEELVKIVAAGLRRARLLEETRRQSVEIALFEQIGRTLTERLDAGVVVGRLIQNIHKLIPAQWSGLYLYDASSKLLVDYIHNREYLPPNSHKSIGLQEESIAGLCFKEQRTVVAHDLYFDQRIDPERYKRLNVRSAIVVPLRSNQNVFGVLSVLHSQPFAFTTEMVRHLEQIAGLAATALERARLYQELQERAEELSLLNEAGKVLVESPILESSLARIGNLLRRHFTADGVGVFLANSSQTALVAQSLSGYQVLRFRNASLGLEENDPTVQAYKENRVLVCNALEPGSLHSALRPALSRVRAYVLVPMVSSNRTIGVLALYQSSERTFSAREIRRLESVAQLAASAVDRSELVKALQASEERYQEVLDAIPLVVMTLDPKGRVLYFNAFAESLTGIKRDEILGRDALTVLLPNQDERHRARQAITEAMQTESPMRNLQFTIRRMQDKAIAINWSGEPMRDAEGKLRGFVWLGIDETERVQLETQLRQIQKMESIGVLAGGLAHDFNNLLGGILGQASLARAQLPADHPVRSIIGKMEAAANRGANLTSKLLTFTRKSLIQPEAVNLAVLIRETVDLLRGSSPRDIRIETSIEEHLPPVLGDATQLHQVLLNLGVNARDAMPGGGTLLFKASAHSRFGVNLAVSDTGEGMTDEVKARIFEPFFTTKEAGKGTGLGLSVVFGIVRSHGGQIQVRSEPGKGTRFEIWLPGCRAGETAVEPEKPELSGMRLAVSLGGNESILLIDDEAMIRETNCELLSRLGYRVWVADGGTAALSQLDAEPPIQPQLVILDVMMPGLSGLPLYKALRERLPNVPVLLISGFSRDTAIQDLLTAGAVELIQKPFRLEVLARAIRSALDKVYKPVKTR